jgi:tRNA pseudouridine55 synthase
MRYKRHDLHGILVIDKPPGMTSMDVVRHVRRAAGHCKTGHGGTLDPLATGVLVCCFGKATKRVPELMDAVKVYEAGIDLSAFTITDDAEGERENVEVLQPPPPANVREVLEQLTGMIEQTPPAYSAVKIGGQRAYKLARKGEDVQPEPRIVRIESIELNDYDVPTLRITITCGKGTYIRSLARQIGEKLGTGGHLTALRRTRVGPYTLDRAMKLDELQTPLNPEHLTEAMEC